MEELFINFVKVEPVCKEGYIVKFASGVAAIHYNSFLAFRKFGHRTLFLNQDYVKIFTRTDLKTIRSIDPSFRKKGHIFYSDKNEIKIVNFRYT